MHRIPHTGIGRSITEIEIDHFLDGKASRQRCREDIDPLGRPFQADDNKFFFTMALYLLIGMKCFP
jgi:hypothetical protein